MNIQTYPIQTTVSGDELTITSFTHTAKKEGLRVYLQANLHGPEIFGSALLIKILDHLRAHPIEQGQLTIVPTANPIGVSTQTYGMIHGRWNSQTGTDWNRQFAHAHPDSLEGSLSHTLLSIAQSHDVVLDIHTSGRSSIPHLYTATASSSFFSSLGADVHMLYQSSDYYGAFDETVWLQAKAQQKHVFAATWEAASHQTIDEELLTKRFINLLHWLIDVGLYSGPTQKNIHKDVPLSAVEWIYTTKSGYLSWLIPVGSIVKSDQPFANVYQPKTGIVETLSLPFAFQLVSQDTLQAVHTGAKIGKVIKW